MLPTFNKSPLYAPEDVTNVRNCGDNTDVIVLRDGETGTRISEVHIGRYNRRRYTKYTKITNASRDRLCNLVYGCSNAFKVIGEEPNPGHGDYVDFFGFSDPNRW